MIVVKVFRFGDSNSTKSVWYCLCCNQDREFLYCVYVRKIAKGSWGEIACKKYSNIVNSFTGCGGSGCTYRRTTIISLCYLFFPYSFIFLHSYLHIKFPTKLSTTPNPEKFTNNPRNQIHPRSLRL